MLRKCEWFAVPTGRKISLSERPVALESIKKLRGHYGFVARSAAKQFR